MPYLRVLCQTWDSSVSLVARLQNMVGWTAWGRKEQGVPSWMESSGVEPVRMKETITQVGERGLGKLLSQEVHAMCGLPRTSCVPEELSTSALGKCPAGRRRSGLWQERIDWRWARQHRQQCSWWVMLACSQPSAFERAGSQAGTKPTAGLELLAKSWEAAVPSVLSSPITHPCSPFAWVGLPWVGLYSFSGSLRCLPVIHLPAWLGAFPIKLTLSHFTALSVPLSEPSANICGELKGEDGE